MRTATATRNTTARRVLIPFVSLLAAASITVASGALFGSNAVSAADSATTGTLASSNTTANTATFAVGNLTPGHSLSGTVTITNDESLPASFALTETSNTATSSTGSDDALTLTIAPSASPEAPVWSGTLGALTAAGPISLAGLWAAGEARSYIFTITLPATADSPEQGASASYQWDVSKTTAILVLG
jgi:spore coat-associated protein N